LFELIIKESCSLHDKVVEAPAEWSCAVLVHGSVQVSLIGLDRVLSLRQRLHLGIKGDLVSLCGTRGVLKLLGEELAPVGSAEFIPTNGAVRVGAVWDKSFLFNLLTEDCLNAGRVEQHVACGGWYHGCGDGRYDDGRWGDGRCGYGRWDVGRDSGRCFGCDSRSNWLSSLQHIVGVHEIRPPIARGRISVGTHVSAPLWLSKRV